MTEPARPVANVWHPVDRLVFGYSVLMAALVALLGRPLSLYVDELLVYAGSAIMTLLIVKYVDEASSRTRAFFRILYPAMLFTVFYRVTGGQMFLLFDRFYDYQVVAFERSLFGEELTLYIDRHLLNTVTNEVLSFCYFCYYLILPGFLIPVFLKRHDAVTREYLAATCLTFFVSYLLFWLYPVEGPRWHLANEYVNSVDGPWFRQLVVFVIDKAAVRGGAMPSSHTGVALVTLMFCFRYYRRAAWWLLPIVIGLALGTFWGRFHYFSDTVVGALIGAAAVGVVWKYLASQTSTKARGPATSQ